MISFKGIYLIINLNIILDDKNLQFVDETEAFSAYKSRASFTPNPRK